MRHLFYFLLGCIALGALWAFAMFIVIVPIGLIVGFIGGLLAYFIGLILYHAWLKHKS
jgi:hypothetical protein